MIEFLGDTLLVIVELFPYGAIGLLGYAWGDYEAINRSKKYGK